QTSEEATESAAEITPTSAPIIPPTVTELSILDRIRLDPVGNSLSILLLLGMLAVLVSAAVQFLTPAKKQVERKTTWLIPILCIIGMGVAGYLSYVETSGELAVCGPVGDCNTVQQSSYANLFGLIPIGVLGLVGYVLILGSWLISNLRSNPLSALAELSLFSMATFGLLFSIYLTFLEPFVIGATCAWCLSSAVIITLIFWLSKDNGRNAINQLKQL
ncbi:MAG: vitamin K epoxide reductase family protein, partial [Anaerolineales bacterium]|nr:vitamin K epoxide reductase family protein [Anaerolineales bacterium]